MIRIGKRSTFNLRNRQVSHAGEDSLLGEEQSFYLSANAAINVRGGVGKVNGGLGANLSWVLDIYDSDYCAGSNRDLNCGPLGGPLGTLSVTLGYRVTVYATVFH